MNNALVETLVGGEDGKGFTHNFTKVGNSNVYTIQTGKNLASLVNVTTAITSDWTDKVDVKLEKLDTAPNAGNTGNFENANYKALASETDTDVKMDNRAIQLKQSDVGTTVTNWTAVRVTITAKAVDGADVEAAETVITLCVNGNT